MCGFAGICLTAAESPALLGERVRRMTSTLVHRGPDEDGFHVDDGVGLGSRRLKVIDLHTGRMPIYNEDRDVVVVYNGEIYNHAELRSELQAKGHRFASNTDTEVVVHLYEEYGLDLVHRIRGMYAFALWDRSRARLLLVRDRLGIKPLHYRLSPAEISFGSELKALLAGMESTPSLDPDGVREYLALGYVRSPLTIYEGCAKLPPGHLLTWTAEDGANVQRYWRPPTSATPFVGTPDDAVDALDTLVTDAVRERLVADVPVGAFLSGGIDSSLVCAVAAGLTSEPLETFTLGWPGSPEPAYARMVSEHIGSRHHELVVDPDCAEMGFDLLHYFDEPFGDSSSIPTYLVSELARSLVTVSLSGDGGDELFGGYQQHAHDSKWAWTDRIPRSLRRATIGRLATALPAGAFGRERLRDLARSRDERFAHFVTLELDPSQGGIGSRRIGDGTDALDLFRARFDEAAALDPRARLLYADLTSYLPDDILVKVDRMSMAHSLEARVPLLDHRIVEFAATLPFEWKIRDGQSKWILKRLAARYLPEAVIDRPKHGFSIPIGEWLRSDLRPWLEAMDDPDAACSAFVDGQNLRRTIREHLDGRRDHSMLLWRILVLERWLQKSPRAVETQLR